MLSKETHSILNYMFHWPIFPKLPHMAFLIWPFLNSKRPNLHLRLFSFLFSSVAIQMKKLVSRAYKIFKIQIGSKVQEKTVKSK